MSFIQSLFTWAAERNLLLFLFLISVFIWFTFRMTQESISMKKQEPRASVWWLYSNLQSLFTAPLVFVQAAHKTPDTIWITTAEDGGLAFRLPAAHLQDCPLQRGADWSPSEKHKSIFNNIFLCGLSAVISFLLLEFIRENAAEAPGEKKLPLSWRDRKQSNDKLSTSQETDCVPGQRLIEV